jgi:UDP-N-acetylglucosamine 2-epimerase (non-hydrolysing)
MHRVLLVVGARPNLMKAAPILQAAARSSSIRVELIHTGQHYDAELSGLLMTDLGMRPPDHALEVGKSTPLGQIASILTGLEAICTPARPALILVVGDVTTTLAAALVANKLSVPLAHVEAGLRSHDPEMPEEWNRRATDLFADVLFCTEPSGVESLLSEGKRDEQIFLVGNVMIDTLIQLLPRAKTRRTAVSMGLSGPYGLVTLHRPSNVDDPVKLGRLLSDALVPLAETVPLVFPVHPRTRARMSDHALAALPSSVRVVPPLGYVDFLALMADAALVLTDSGGVQEETTVLGVPCLTLRDNTERPVTIELGTNELVGAEPSRILAAARRVLTGPPKGGRAPPLWDGRAAARVISIIEGFLDGGPQRAVSRARDCGALVGTDGLARG